MAIDELTARLKARAFVSKANPLTVPVSMDAYLTVSMIPLPVGVAP